LDNIGEVAVVHYNVR